MLDKKTEQWGNLKCLLKLVKTAIGTFNLNAKYEEDARFTQSTVTKLFCVMPRGLSERYKVTRDLRWKLLRMRRHVGSIILCVLTNYSFGTRFVTPHFWNISWRQRVYHKKNSKCVKTRMLEVGFKHASTCRTWTS